MDSRSLRRDNGIRVPPHIHTGEKEARYSSPPKCIKKWGVLIVKLTLKMRKALLKFGCLDKDGISHSPCYKCRMLNALKHDREILEEDMALFPEWKLKEHLMDITHLGICQTVELERRRIARWLRDRNL